MVERWHPSVKYCNAAIRAILDGFHIQRPELSAWGEVVEEPGTFKFFLGWNSVEVFIMFTRFYFFIGLVGAPGVCQEKWGT